ncbi:unnamed protein product [Polarella glacialis]|uniref:Uncharacterized protein n=1 Tax=Polarella glacialis TaxID=89957 RepID=A0A813D5A0_POLGL|nr:unnamed protein product [Polarella glacialis]
MTIQRPAEAMEPSDLTTAGTIIGDTPDLFKPMLESFQSARESLSEELNTDPAPDFTCKEILDTTTWLKSIVGAMEEHSNAFSKGQCSGIDDATLQRNQALARETSRQLTLLLADKSKPFSGSKLECQVVEFVKDAQCQEIRQNLADFEKFLDHFSDSKWLGSFIAPEFANEKEIAVRLLKSLQNPVKRELPGCKQQGDVNATTAVIATIKVQAPLLFDELGGSPDAKLSSAMQLERLAKMAEALAAACHKDATARAQAEQELEKKMRLLKGFAEAMHDVPEVLRRFFLIRSGSIKGSLEELKEWVTKEEADAVHMKLEEFRDEAAEERVLRRLRTQSHGSTGSWEAISLVPSDADEP